MQYSTFLLSSSLSFSIWVAFQAVSPCRLTGLHVHGCPDPRTSKGRTGKLREGDGRGTSYRGGPQGANEELPQVPVGELGSRRLMSSAAGWLFSSPNSNCHRWGLERVLRPLWWFDTSPDPLFQREGPPLDETQV